LGRPLDLQAHPYSVLARLAGHRAYEAKVFPKTAIHLDNDIAVASGRHPGPWPKDCVFTPHAWCRQPPRAGKNSRTGCMRACHQAHLSSAYIAVRLTWQPRLALPEGSLFGRCMCFRPGLFPHWSYHANICCMFECLFSSVTCRRSMGRSRCQCGRLVVLCKPSSSNFAYIVRTSY
jgi:hypothetical protein